MAKKSDTIKVPGAQLYYEVQGEGPVLLIIPGGPSDTGAFDMLVPYLKDRYTTVVYDPRGNSRSTLDGPPQDQDVPQHADDARRLIEALGGGPVHVLGSSGGAQIALALTALYPEHVRTLVAHEPPCVRLLPDADEILKGMQEVQETSRTTGWMAASAIFNKLIGMEDYEPPQGELPPEAQEGMNRMMGNMDYFFSHGMSLAHYEPDVETLRSRAPRVVVGIGTTSAGQLAYNTGVALAERLGSEPAVFPGDHGGFAGEPEGFAAVLDGVLRES